VTRLAALCWHWRCWRVAAARRETREPDVVVRESTPADESP
jgi:hypothetical protein